MSTTRPQTNRKTPAKQQPRFCAIPRDSMASARPPSRHNQESSMTTDQAKDYERIEQLHEGSGNLDRFDVVARLAELLRAWNTMPSEERRSEAGRVTLAEVRGIGEAAAYFGGFDAMQALDRHVSRTGAPNHHLNGMWDLIGGWVA